MTGTVPLLASDGRHPLCAPYWLDPTPGIHARRTYVHNFGRSTQTRGTRRVPDVTRTTMAANREYQATLAAEHDLVPKRQDKSTQCRVVSHTRYES